MITADLIVPNSIADRVSLLTPRERAVLALVLQGETSRQIAICLKISKSSVGNYRNRINRKLGDYGKWALSEA